MVALLLYARDLKGLDASSAVSVMNLVAVFGVLFAILLLGEPLVLPRVLGELVVAAGTALSVQANPEDTREPREKRAPRTRDPRSRRDA